MKKVRRSTTAPNVVVAEKMDVAAFWDAFVASCKRASAASPLNGGTRPPAARAPATAAAVARAYVACFAEKMLGELEAGGRKPVEHVFRNLALFLSPPVTALDGGGRPLADLRLALPDGGAAYDALRLDGARLADAVLAALPCEGASPHDPGRVLVRADLGARGKR